MSSFSVASVSFVFARTGTLDESRVISGSGGEAMLEQAEQNCKLGVPMHGKEDGDGDARSLKWPPEVMTAFMACSCARAFSAS